MEKIILFGGSFNPVHDGHIQIAEDAFDFVEADKLILIPTLNHPTKTVTITNYTHILNMLKLALASSMICDYVEIESYELEQFDKISYTFDTVKYLKLKYPKSELYLLIGSDNLKTISTWNRYEELKELVTLIVGERAGVDYEKIENVEYRLFKTSAPEVCSSSLRESILHNEDVDDMLDSDVALYIKDKKLYVNEA